MSQIHLADLVKNKELLVSWAWEDVTSQPEELFQLLHSTNFVTKLHIPGGSSSSPFKEALGVGQRTFCQVTPRRTWAASVK